MISNGDPLSDTVWYLLVISGFLIILISLTWFLVKTGFFERYHQDDKEELAMLELIEEVYGHDDPEATDG